MNDSLLLPIDEASQVGEARRTAVAVARARGFDQTGTEKAAIVVTEMASNLVKHTQGGQLFIQTIEEQGVIGIELLALDQGPGMGNLAACLRDGYSTIGSRGEGLGAIRRMASFFDIYSLPGAGTALLARLWAQPPPAHPRRQLEFAVISVPMQGESVNGDGWAIDRQADCSLVLVVDGLGHGPLAAAAAQQVVRVFKTTKASEPAALFEKMHQALRNTRGAAVAVAAIGRDQQVTFVGVGNIAGAVLTANGNQHTVSHNGTVGHVMRRVQPFTYAWAPDALLVLHSDGLSARWDLNAYPGLRTRHVSLIAGVLYRDFKRDRDDVTVLVAKEAA